MANKNKLAIKIKKARLEVQLSQGELGNLINLSDKSISAYEAGRATPPLSVLGKISQATQKPLAYFVNGGNETQHTIVAKLTVIERELNEIKKLLKKQ